MSVIGPVQSNCHEGSPVRCTVFRLRVNGWHGTDQIFYLRGTDRQTDGGM